MASPDNRSLPETKDVSPDNRSLPETKDVKECKRRLSSTSGFKNSAYYDKFLFFEKQLNRSTIPKVSDDKVFSVDTNIDENGLHTFKRNIFVEDNTDLNTSQLKQVTLQHSTDKQRPTSFKHSSSSICLTSRTVNHEKTTLPSGPDNQNKTNVFLYPNSKISNVAKLTESDSASNCRHAEQVSTIKSEYSQQQYKNVHRATSEPLLSYNPATICLSTSADTNPSSTKPATSYTTSVNRLHSSKLQKPSKIPTDYSRNELLSHDSILNIHQINTPISQMQNKLCISDPLTEVHDKSSKSYITSDPLTEVPDKSSKSYITSDPPTEVHDKSPKSYITSDPLTVVPDKSSKSYITSVEACSEDVINKDKDVTSSISCDKFMTLIRKTSTASITLAQLEDVSNMENKNRKIHVIKYRQLMPHTEQGDNTTRIDEWVSSVMKLQNERNKTESCVFPEDDPYISNFHNTLRTSQSQNGDKAQISSISAGSQSSNDQNNSSRHIQRRWSSTGINTDISILTTHVHKPSYISDVSCTVSTTSRLQDNTKLCKNETVASITVPHSYSSAPVRINSHTNCWDYSLQAQNSSSKHFNYGRSQSTGNLFEPVTLMERKIKASTTSISSSLQKSFKSKYTISKHPAVNPAFSHISEHRKINPAFTHISKHREVNPTSTNTSNHFETNHVYKTEMNTKNCQEFKTQETGIRICVTGDDDRNIDDSKTLLYSDNTSNVVLPAGDKVDQGSTEQPTTVRGLSPHYMFPSGHPGSDEDEVLYDTLSPRNSLGSINSDYSARSYKSSNADSAVDLGPTDEDHEFENNDFIVRNQIHKCSHSDERSVVKEEKFSGRASVVNPLDLLVFVDNIQSSAESTAQRIHSGVPVLQSNFRNIKNKVFSESSKSLKRVIKKPQNQRSEIEDSVIERSELIVCSSNETSQGIALKESSNSTTLLKSDVDHIRINQNYSESRKIKDEANVEVKYNVLDTQCNQTSRISNEEEKLWCFPESFNATEYRKLQTFEKENLQLQLESNNQNEQLQKEQHVIPELIISDHSCSNGKQNNVHSCADIGEEEMDIESPLESMLASSLSCSEIDLLRIERSTMHRTSSMSSLSSITSTCSTCTAVSDSEMDDPKKKQSSWRKIRSFILWSPFIQVFKKHRYPWIQLAGHQGNFHAGEAGCVLKKLDSREHACFQRLMTDTLKDYVPEYRGDVDKNGDTYIQLQDLLCSFSHPCVMDVKMGVRTYLEDELQKARKSPSLRKDMYQKMIEIDNGAPTTEEHEHKAVTKPRYMQWRDEMSSSVELGFRVEGIKKSDGNSSKDFKKTKNRESVVDIMKSFIGDNEIIVAKYIRRLKEMMSTQETSEFFMSHEIIGSSLLFVHDVDDNVGVWMIDFGKSDPLPNGVKINHRSKWNEGNHEDGYLFGLDNLISILEEVQRSLLSSAV